MKEDASPKETEKTSSTAGADSDWLEKGPWGLLSDSDFVRGEPEAGLRQGDRLGGYTILKALDKGGMGEVYLATGGIHREVAIKILPRAAAQDKQRLMRFQREAKILAELDHPSITRIYEFAYDKEWDLYFFVMKYIKGQTIAGLIARQALSIEECLRIFHDIASALEAAHKQGIVHRDLKPLNIMVSNDNEVKLLDFGIGKHFASVFLPTTKTAPFNERSQPLISTARDHSGLQPQSAVWGTIPYMSPEMHARADIEENDVQAAIALDMWAFGMVMFEALAHSYAFRRRVDGSVINAILYDEPDWQILPEATPPPIRKLLEQLLSKDPIKRWRSAGEAKKLIAKCQNRRPWRQFAAAIVYRFKQPAYLLLSCGVFLLFAVPGYWVINQRRATITLAVMAGQPAQKNCDQSSEKICALVRNTLKKHDRIRIIPDPPLTEGIANLLQDNLIAPAEPEPVQADYTLKITPLCGPQSEQVEYLFQKGTAPIAQGETAIYADVVTAVENHLHLTQVIAPPQEEAYISALTDLKDYFDLAKLEKARTQLEQLHQAAGEKQYTGALALVNYLIHKFEEEEGHPKQATAARKKALELCDTINHIDDRLFCGEVLVGVEDYDKAIALLQAYRAERPQDGEAVLALALAHDGKGEVKRAEDLFYEARDIHSSKAAVTYSLAAFYFEQGRFEEAASYFRQTGQRYAVLNPHVQNGLALALYYQDNWAEALQECEQTVTYYQNEVPPGLVQTQAMLYLGKGQCDKAIEIIDNFLGNFTQYQNDAQITGLYADACACGLFNSSQARQHYRKAIKLGEERLKLQPDSIFWTSLVAEWQARINLKLAANTNINRALSPPKKIKFSAYRDVLVSAVKVFCLTGEEQKAKEIYRQYSDDKKFMFELKHSPESKTCLAN